MPLPGCVEEYDLLADKMLEASTKPNRETVLRAMEAALAKTTDEKTKKRGDLYQKIMKKIVSDGPEFVAKETARTKKMMEGKIAEAKKKELSEKINVLRSFTPQDDGAVPDARKTEL